MTTQQILNNGYTQIRDNYFTKDDFSIEVLPDFINFWYTKTVIENSIKVHYLLFEEADIKKTEDKCLEIGKKFDVWK